MQLRSLRLTGLFHNVSFLILFSILGLQSCQPSNPDFQKDAANPEFLHRSMKKLTDVIVHDIFSPPVASRIYAYPSIAAYEVLAVGDENYQTLAGQLTGLKPIPKPETGKEICLPLSAVHAFLKAGKAFVFSEDKITEFETEIFGEFEALNMPSSVYNYSMEYGSLVANHILEWSSKDKYKETRTHPKYTFNEEPASWKPTPPDYMQGIEPHWKIIRPFVIDSSDQFVPEPPTAFSLDTDSEFFKEVMEVYETVKNLDEERKSIASFWDCNPYVSHHMGHAMFATKKITPGGHWIGITMIASRKAKANMLKSAEAYAVTSVALADGFISCWDEKWRSILIRPETVINEQIDPDWAPLLQTPPFPEYTSGHSVISSAAAVALTHIYGDNFSFVDSTEVEYGLPVRSFKSFFDASEEAAISRLYGGIHYMPAIENGVKQGKQVGEFVVHNLITRKREQ